MNKLLQNIRQWRTNTYPKIQSQIVAAGGKLYHIKYLTNVFNGKEDLSDNLLSWLRVAFNEDGTPKPTNGNGNGH